MNDDFRKLVNDFDLADPDWKSLPADFPDCDLSGFTGREVGKFNAVKGAWQVSRAGLAKEQETRTWKDPGGFERMAVWQNASLLRLLVRKFTAGLPSKEHRLKAQLDDAARSVKRNIEEGWKRPTSSEYLQFLGYSQASLEEVKGDLRDAKTDGFLKSVPGSALKNTGIDLSVFKGREVKGAPEEPGHPYYEPLSKIKYGDLTYEMFLELANKTDWLFRRTVKSVEDKLIKDKRYYELQQAKIRSNLRFR